MADWELAQINIAKLIAPLDDPRIADFVAQLATVNALAEMSTGFLWRLESGAAETRDDAFADDPLVLVNMSVWENVESLRAFTYQSREHLAAFRNRAQWFERMEVPHYCLWWIPAGQRPSPTEGRRRLELYRERGSSAESFWFGQQFAPPRVTAV